MSPSNPLPQLSSTIKKLHTLAFSILVLAVSPAVADETLRIGGLLHLTGEFSVQGQAFREGMELGAETLRDANNASVQLIFEDTQYQALRSVTGAKKLLSSDHVHAAVISTAVEAKAAGPEFQRAKIPALVLWDSSPEIEAIGDHIFAIGPWTPASGERMAEFATNRIRAKTAAIVHTNTEWSAAVANAFKLGFERLGGTILSLSNENPSETDFRTTLMKAKRKNPDVFYVPVDANLIAFFNQAKQLGIQVPLLTSDIITEDNLQEDAAAFAGVYQSMPSIGDSDLLKDLLARYQKKFGVSCTQTLFVAWGFDAVRLLFDAHQRSKSTAAGLREALLATAHFPGASNIISMNERGSAPAPLAIFQVEAGRFRLLPRT